MPASPDGPAGAPAPARAIARPVRARRDPAVGAVLVGLVVAAATTALVGVREGAVVLAGVLALGAVARAVLPVAWAGSLANRGRLVDVLVLGGLACGVAVLARVVPVV